MLSKKMAKDAAIAFCVVAATLLSVSCSGKKSGDVGKTIFATTFAAFDWTREIIGEVPNFELRLIGNGDFHSFQPGFADIAELSSCSLLIYVGGESDEWIGESETINKKGGGNLLRLFDALGGAVKVEEFAEGMQGALDGGNDEHVWLSLRNAKVCCRAIADALSEIDAENAAKYFENCEKYCEKIDEIDARLSALEGSFGVPLIFADRFPFRYFCDDYGIEYFAAFPGCSSDAVASFETLAFLVEKVSLLRPKCVFIIDGSDGALARTVIENAGVACRVVSLDSMQSADGAATYLEAMAENAEKIAANGVSAR